MGSSMGSSFGNWMPKVCEKLLCDLGQWAKSDVLYKPSKMALITGCGLRWTTTTWQSLPSTSFPIPFFLIRRMVEIDQSNLSAIYWAVRQASVNFTTTFPCCSDNIVCVCNKNYNTTTTCLNEEEPLSYSLMTVWYVTVLVYRIVNYTRGPLHVFPHADLGVASLFSWGCTCNNYSIYVNIDTIDIYDDRFVANWSQILQLCESNTNGWVVVTYYFNSFKPSHFAFLKWKMYHCVYSTDISSRAFLGLLRQAGLQDTKWGSPSMKKVVEKLFQIAGLFFRISNHN